LEQGKVSFDVWNKGFGEAAGEDALENYTPPRGKWKQK